MVYFSYVLMTILMLSGLFLIGLILLQRGRGGGLAGAFGGMGGQSAFGTKAGDVFTRITIGVACTWILLCCVGVNVLHMSGDQRADDRIFAKDAPTDKLPKAPAKSDIEQGADVVPPAATNNEPPEKDAPALKDAAVKQEEKKADEAPKAVEVPAEPAKPTAPDAADAKATDAKQDAAVEKKPE